ncbi:MAG: DUF2829 domain-containing protein [Alistipes sp.]
MKFSEIIDKLQQGGIARRYSDEKWAGKYIVKQIPQTIPQEVIPNMTSLPTVMKAYLSTVGDCQITYHNQVLIVSLEDGKPNTATYYIPTWEDIFAEDWAIQ